MELREYVKLFTKNLWVIITVTLAATTLTLIFSYQQVPVYESSSTYVARLRPTTEGFDQVYSLDTLMGRARIQTTYCDLIESHAVWNRSLQLLNLDATTPWMLAYLVECTVLPESSVLKIVVRGPVPTLVERFNQAIGLAGMERVNALFPPFPIEPLDEVTLNPVPVSPNHLFNIALGGVLGFAVSLALIMGIDYMRSPQQSLQALSIRDNRFNLYNLRYFQMRLTEEINRSRVRRRPVSMAAIRILPNEDFALMPESVRESLLRLSVMQIEDNLNPGDILTHWKGLIFYALMPETPGDEAFNLMTRVNVALRGEVIEVGSYQAYFTANAGIVENNAGVLDTHETVETAVNMLEKADQQGENQIEMTCATADFSDGNNNQSTSLFWKRKSEPVVTPSTASSEKSN
jgi:capsular polysaccharide biosynthesis protein/GGDEF domain-containing protein